MQPLTRSGAASEKGYALKVAEERKMAAHNAECRGAGVSVVPLAVESVGGWSHEAALQISRIGRLVGQRLGITPAETVSHLFQPSHAQRKVIVVGRLGRLICFSARFLSNRGCCRCQTWICGYVQRALGTARV